MNDFLKMDVFFFITTVALVLLTSFGAVVLWRLSNILKHIEHVSEQIALETDGIRSDLDGMPTDIREGKGRLKSLFGFFGTTAKRILKNA